MGVRRCLNVFLDNDEAETFRKYWSDELVDTLDTVFDNMLSYQAIVCIDPERVESVADLGVQFAVRVGEDDGHCRRRWIHMIRITMASGTVFLDFTDESLEEYLHEWELV